MCLFDRILVNLPLFHNQRQVLLLLGRIEIPLNSLPLITAYAVRANQPKAAIKLSNKPKLLKPKGVCPGLDGLDQFQYDSAKSDEFRIHTNSLKFEETTRVENG